MDPRYEGIDFDHYFDDWYETPFVVISYCYDKDGNRTIKKEKNFYDEDEVLQYERYSDLKDKYKENRISEKEFKEYELMVRYKFINKHFEQFKKLKPYGRYKTITKMYNSKYDFNISDNEMKIYLINNFKL